jgi:hypothetical protein
MRSLYAERRIGSLAKKEKKQSVMLDSSVQPCLTKCPQRQQLLSSPQINHTYMTGPSGESSQSLSGVNLFSHNSDVTQSVRIHFAIQGS